MLRQRWTVSSTQVHPRIRGEYSVLPLRSFPNSGSPPHTRGIFKGRTLKIRKSRFTPAYAGTILFFFCRHTDLQVHPRIRGEYFLEFYNKRDVTGSPPHTRGIFRIHWNNTLCVRFTPAYAGNICFLQLPFDYVQVHPRIRGEYSFRSILEG